MQHIIMSVNLTEVVEAVRRLTPAEQREVLARLWPERAARSGDTVWISLRFSDALRVVAYAPEQQPYVAALRDLLVSGALARPENKADGTYGSVWC